MAEEGIFYIDYGIYIMIDMQQVSLVAGTWSMNSQVVVTGLGDSMLTAIEIWLMGIAEGQGVVLQIWLIERQVVEVDGVQIGILIHGINGIYRSFGEQGVAYLQAHTLAHEGVDIVLLVFGRQTVEHTRGIGCMIEMEI